MSRVWNFSAGPATLPEEVLKQAAEEMLDWRGKGLSVMEMSHRSPEYTEIFEHAKRGLVDLLSIPETHDVLFMQGGAVGMNAIVPMNLLRGFDAAAFVNTGSWSKKTAKEFAKYGRADVVLSNDADLGQFKAGSYVPDCGALVDSLKSKKYAYLHFCDNETIGGVEFNGQIEQIASQLAFPVVSDMSSNILSRPIDWNCHGLVYGGAQKNIGPAGVTLVVIEKRLLGRSIDHCPSAFEFATVAENGSMYNTPPTYAIYIAGLVFDWLKRKGGVAWAQAEAQRKSALLYKTIDDSQFYTSPVRPEDRSKMNVPFVLADESLNARFLSDAANRGLVQLKGHKSVGGMRASIYNAMPYEGVLALTEFMREFEKEVA
ncbi:3-phosphoserine/phosphohydroxythreonine transaminase [Limnobacter litoralis]|uniref:Phosphoserine aminotransferase n=2 Tax=Limnobacter TaxID=131079 RepID=A0ABQ5YRG7_9BURK|nr:3-phosphoserine/phosphohydroxythreonine transaminase [Limnobacter litoralis]GLR26031.1 phosphoserine aminotransferase [Limnobacter litoralis]